MHLLKWLYFKICMAVCFKLKTDMIYLFRERRKFLWDHLFVSNYVMEVCRVHTYFVCKVLSLVHVCTSALNINKVYNLVYIHLHISSTTPVSMRQMRMLFSTLELHTMKHCLFFLDRTNCHHKTQKIVITAGCRSRTEFHTQLPNVYIFFWSTFN